MLSILIPTYNYNVFPLAKSLHTQCVEENIPFEIIALDDASNDTDLHKQNEQINSLSNSGYKILSKNIGRSAIRNLLAKQAKYDWLLFLDADTLPIDNRLISNYLPFLDNKGKVVYGGIKYQETAPEASLLLRWIYGNEREALPADKRVLSPYLSLLTLNFAIRKSVFEKVSFNETIPNLRHEDTLFSYELSQAKIKVEHIDNPVYHLGLDTSEIFLKKSEESVVGLKYLLDNNLLSPDYIKIAKVYCGIKKSGLKRLMAFFYKCTGGLFRKNLIGAKPSLFIFDLYRLGYLMTLK